MNNNAFEVLADGTEEGELISVESFKFTGLVPDGKVSIQEENFNKTDYPSTVSLLACSGKYGYFVAGHVQGFVFGQTKALRGAFYSSEKGTISTLNEKTIIPLTRPVYQLRLSCDEQTVLVALSDGTLLSFSVIDIMEKKENAQPKHSVNFGGPIIDLRPNTEFLPDSACVLLTGNQCRIINWKTGETMANIPGSDFSAICWSPKGKQVVCGRLDGTLEHYDLAGIKKDSLPSPESMQAGYDDENVNRAVQDVLWIETHQFLVLYSRPPEPESDEFINTGYIVDRKPKVGTGPKYTHLAEVTPIFSPEGRSNHFYMETIYGFGDRFPHVIVLANGATNEISVVGEDDQGNWATWDLPENGMASLPLSEETNFDTFPLGMALDFSASEKLPPYDPSESDVGVEPVPVLFHLNDEGQIGSFHCYNEDFAIAGTKYQGMKTPTIPTADMESPATTAAVAAAVAAPLTTTPTSAFGTTTQSTTTSAFGTSSASPFAASSFSSGPFGAALNSGSSGSSFASLTKVQGATTPSFHGMGSTSGFGSLAKNTVPNAVTPTFGSTTSFGASSSSSSSSPAPTFGSTTGFGASPVSAFGSTTSFGSLQKKDGATSVPAFGSTTSFGSVGKKEDVSAFGSTTTTTSTSGFASFGKKEGSTNTSLPFGSTTFGSPSVTSEEKKDSSAPFSSFGSVTKEATAKEDKETGGVPLFGSLALDDKEKTMKESAQVARSDKKDKQEEETPTGDDTKDTDREVDDKEITSTTEEESLLNTGCLATDKPTPTPTLTSTTTTTTTIPEKATTTTPSTGGFVFGSPAQDKTTTGTSSTPSFGSTTTTTTTGFGGLAKNTVPGATSFGGFGASTPSSTPATGFGALAKNTVPGATTPTFGSPSNLGSNSGFGSLAKNTVPGAMSPATTFGSTSSFGSLAKNTVPGATTTFGSPSKLGSGPPGGSGFGALAKNTVPGAINPTFGSTTTFGASTQPPSGSSAGLKDSSSTFKTLPVTNSQSPPTPPTQPSITLKSSDTTTPSTRHATFKESTQKEPEFKDQDKPTVVTATATLPSGPKPEAKEEGMAKEFEALYFKITAELEKLSTLQADFGTQLQDQGKQLHTVVKSVQNLTDNVEKWRLGESGVVGTIAETIGDQLKKNPIKDQQNKMDKLEAKTMELVSKKEQIKQCLETKEDPEWIHRLAERDLDDTTREECETLETRCQRSGELLGELEYRMVNKTQQQRKPIQTDTSHFSFYDFHCAIRDVERDLKRKDVEVKELERKLSLLRFREHQRKAEYSPSTITFEDLSDNEEDEDTDRLNGHYSEEQIDYTVKYIQEEQSLDKLCALTCQRPPFTVNEEH